MKAYLLTSKEHEICKTAEFLFRQSFPDGEVVYEIGDELKWIESGAALFCFLSKHIVPKYILDRTKLAVNFHPGSPMYPGIGGYNFALYEGAKSYGCVAHLMAEKVDVGGIIGYALFPISKNETVLSLQIKTHVRLMHIFAHTLDRVEGDNPLFPILEWERKPFTRKQLNELCVLTREMSDEEIKKRVLATAYPGKPCAQFEFQKI